MVDLYGFALGGVVEIPIAGKPTFTVAGVWRDYARPREPSPSSASATSR
jgi:hypothetical protein